MKGMKLLQVAVAVLAITATTANCDLISPQAEEDNTALLALFAASQPVNVSGAITSDTTWPSAVLLTGAVTVESGATLTVPAGATVYGNSGSVLVIKEGGKIIAEGTSGAPIVFTSAKAPGVRAPGDWGGLVIIGKGINTRNAAAQVEGTGDTSLTYGSGTGRDNADSSGSLKYVRVEFAGFTYDTDKEFNCVSSYTVGSGTTYDHVQCLMGQDDSFEWWGGAVNGKYLLSVGTGDDDFDMDEGFIGNLQFIIAYRYPSSAGSDINSDSHGFEMDGSHSSGVTPLAGTMTNPTVKNFTFIGANTEGAYGMRAREGMQGSFTNGLIWHPNTGNFKCDTNSGGGSATNPSFSAVLVEAAKSAGDSSAACAGRPTTGLTAQPVTTLITVYDGSATPNFQPTGEGAATATAVTGTSFFTANTTYGGMQSGDDWTSGWTNYRSN